MVFDIVDIQLYFIIKIFCPDDTFLFVNEKAYNKNNKKLRK